MPPKKKKQKVTEVIVLDDSPEPPDPVCHLLRLPAELRNRIWTHLVHCPTYDLDPTLSPKAYPFVRYRIFGNERGVKVQQQPAITRVSRQIRQEALSLYYSVNTFMFGTDDSSKSKKALEATRQKTADWIVSIGKDARYLRRVRLPISVGHPLLSYTRTITHFITCNITGDVDSFQVSNNDQNMIETWEGWDCFARHCQRLQETIKDFLRAHDGDDGMEKLWRALALLARNLVRIDEGLAISGDMIEQSWRAPGLQRRNRKRTSLKEGSSEQSPAKEKASLQAA